MKKDKAPTPPAAHPSSTPESDQFHRTMKALLAVPPPKGEDKRPTRQKKA